MPVTTQPATKPETKLTAEELRRLPEDERNAILAAASLAEKEYLTDKQLTEFEAFGEEDLHGESVMTAQQVTSIASAIALCVGAP